MYIEADLSPFLLLGKIRNHVIHFNGRSSNVISKNDECCVITGLVFTITTNDLMHEHQVERCSSPFYVNKKCTYKGK